MATMTAQERLAESNAFLRFAHTTFAERRAKGLVSAPTRCKHCILSTMLSDLDDGICQECRSSRPSRSRESLPERGEASERALLDEILKTGANAGKQDYDALVMFSGGKDSTFLLHQLRADHPDLRILAVTIDSGYASSVALQNAERISRMIDGIDAMIVRPRKDLFHRAFRHVLTHPKLESCYLTVDLLDGELTFDIGRNLAANMAIPLFIAGTSPAQIRMLHNLDSFERPRELMLARRTHTTGGYPVEDLSDASALHYWWDGTRWPPERVPRNLLPYHAWEYDEVFIQREVVRLGYLEGGHENPLATNNLLIPLMVSIDYARLGYCGFEPEFALLVREGRAARETWCNIFDAAAHLAATGDFLRGSVDDVLQRLDLRREDVGLPP